MHLKSLNLKGFKSFADRSVLSFEPGITAIVGPNGSGKSNISDSVLWVLGERNAKNLRGQAMEDVVFAGSSARKPVGVAEVDLVLDNSDGILPIDFNEVVITRRMYRSGESEYLINGALARRMDVLDILHDTGLGTGTHSIISQGSLDSLLQSKPEDRRMLIEEAAGVLKHKQRKLKSERKLEQMDNHLMRVKDVAAEVERQLKPLERKAKRAQAYQGLAAELAELNLALAVDDLRVLQEAWKKVNESEQLLAGELEAARASIKATEENMQLLQEQIQERSMDVGGVAQKYRRAQSAIERLDAASLLLHEKKRAALNYETEIQITLEANTLKTVQLIEASQEASLQLEKTAAERSQAEEIVLQLEKEQAELSERRNKLESLLEISLGEERSYNRDIERARLAQAENQELLSNNKAHEKLIAGHTKELGIQLERVEQDYATSLVSTGEFEKKLSKLKEEESLAREAVASCFSEREAAQKSTEVYREQLAALTAEVRGIEELERALEASSPSLAWLLDNKNRFKAKISSLAHLISVPEGLETMVEWLLGANIRALVVDDIDNAKIIAETLQETGEVGEVTLLPQKGARASQNKEPSKGSKLVSLLEYPAEYEHVLETLMGKVYLCDTVADAFQAYKDSGSGYSFATRDGLMVGDGGKVKIGTGHLDAEGVLARHRKLEHLRKEKERNHEQLGEAIVAKEAVGQKLQQAQTKSLTLSQQLAQLQGNYLASQEELKRVEEKLAALRREYEDLSRQKAEARSILASAEPVSAELAKKLLDLQERLELSKKKSTVAQNDIEPLREQVKTLDERLSQARLEKARLSERENYAKRMLAANENDADSLKQERQASQEMLVRKTIAKKRTEPLLVLFNELASSARRWTLNIEEEMNHVQNLSSGLHTAATEARKQSRKAHDAFNAVNEKLSEDRVEKGRLEVQVETAIDTIVHDCKTPLEAVLDAARLEDRPIIEETAFKLRRRIANMGTINPDAAFEYEELKTRFDYMARQLDDMMSARRALSKIVRVIDTRMKEDFVSTFEQVNANFREIFAVLFPGGSAELLLVDPSAPETSGVEVTAQPKGKRITKMMLMSGGEKSLTALALLFAVYRTRSTPFYILDEVEAALDDTNLRRLCTYFDSLRQRTQLILITHQRRTMEIADVLYGISMQADGVTQVVSQKLDRALQYAEE